MVAFHAIIVLAIAFMILGLTMALRLKRIAPGGTIGRVVTILLGLIVLFLAGYLAAPLLPTLPRNISFGLIALVFLFGAIYVVLVLWLITRLIRQVMKDLEL